MDRWTDEVRVAEITLPLNPCKKTHLSLASECEIRSYCSCPKYKPPPVLKHMPTTFFLRGGCPRPLTLGLNLLTYAPPPVLGLCQGKEPGFTWTSPRGATLPSPPASREQSWELGVGGRADSGSGFSFCWVLVN